MGKPVDPQQLRTELETVVHEAVFLSVLNCFRCPRQEDGSYVVGVSSIVRFVLSEMAVIKQEFLKS